MVFIFSWSELDQQAFQSDELANTDEKQLIIQVYNKCKQQWFYNK